MFCAISNIANGPSIVLLASLVNTANGGATLSGYVLRLLFENPALTKSLDSLAVEVIELLGEGLTHSDQYVSSSCASSLGVAFR